MDEKSGNYLAFISGQNLEDGSLSPKDILDIQSKLWTLLGQRTQRFTQGDSSSVPLEIAQELFKSICYSFDIYRKSHGNMSIRALLQSDEDIAAPLRLAWLELDVQFKAGRALLKKAKQTWTDYGNVSYQDTLMELRKFFQRYDYRFFAHDIPCSIDYQLCIRVPKDLLGIEYINEYLRRLNHENDFSGHFDKKKVVALLRSHSSDYREQLMNIFEPIFTNAVGLTLVHGDVLSLNITEYDRLKLVERFHRWDTAKTQAQLLAAAETLCDKLDIREEATREYLRGAAMALCATIKAAAQGNSFDRLFLSLVSSEEDEPETVFIDGDTMIDEQLREFIDELQDCHDVRDRIARVKVAVHSVSDLVEIMDICFWNEEYFELFKTFSDSELGVLLQFLRQEHGDLNEWEPEAPWEIQLVDYLKFR